MSWDSLQGDENIRACVHCVERNTIECNFNQLTNSGIVYSARKLSPSLLRFAASGADFVQQT